MSNLSFARIMYGAGQEPHSPAFAPMSNLPPALQNSSPTTSQDSSHVFDGATVESILHKVSIALSEKK
jgi:hypothetical protein